MLRSSRILLALALILAGCLVGGSVARADRTVEMGFEDPAVLSGAAPDSPQVIATWHRMGVDWVRVQAFWDAVSPDKASPSKPAGFDVANPDDPRYDWRILDEAVARVRANGMRVMLAVHQFNPVWASTEPGRGQLGWKPSPQLYAQFATAVARRYGSQVDRYLLGNEPNEKVFLQPQTECRPPRCERSAANIYRELVRAAYPAIKRIDPDPVLMGELAPIGAIGKHAGNLAPLAFIRALGCLDDRYRPIRTGACRRFKPARADGFGYHPYQVRERPTQPQRNPNLAKLGDTARLFGVLDRLTRARRILAPHRRFNVYFTEYGYETYPDMRNGVSPAQQSRYLQEAAYIAWSTPRIKLISQYLWRDAGNGPDGKPVDFQSGLLFADFQPKPALAFFAHPIFIDQRHRTPVLWGQVRPGDVHQVRVFRRIGGGQFKPFVSVRTDRLGYFARRGRLRHGSDYVFSYTQDGQTYVSDVAHAR